MLTIPGTNQIQGLNKTIFRMDTKQLLDEAFALCDRLEPLTWAAALKGEQERHDRVESILFKALRRAARRERLHEQHQSPDPASAN